MALGNNVKKRREQLGLTQDELANAVGVTQVAIANLEKRDSKSSRNLTALSKALNISSSELETGLSDFQQKKVILDVWEKESRDTYDNTYGAVQPKDFVPVISWVQAGEFDEVVDIYAPGYSEEQVARINGGPRVYALYVRGDSMTAPPGVSPSFPEGYIIHVDPEQDVSNGDCAIAKINGQAKVTFKQFKMGEDVPYLKPLNPDHKPIYEEFRVLGKVIGASIKL